MRDDGAEDTSDVASGECDDQLFLLAALVSRFGDDVLVQRLECALEARELHHRVRNLSAPQWHKTFVETAKNSRLNFGNRHDMFSLITTNPLKPSAL